METSPDPAARLADALAGRTGLFGDYMYRLPFDDYVKLPDPFPRTTFSHQEVQASIRRYPDPRRPGRLFQWDIHGRLLTPAKRSLPDLAMVMIHGGAANEYEFLFTPDGPSEFVDLTHVDPSASRVGVAQHVASLGVPVLAISLPGHFSHDPWPPIDVRRPEFVIGEIPDDEDLEHRLAVYTFRMCVEAVNTLVENSLPGEDLFVWGHSTAGEFPFLLEQYGLRNHLVGVIGYGAGAPASIRRKWEDYVSGTAPQDRVAAFRPITGLSRRSAKGYTEHGYTGPNQPWGDAEAWFALENDRRPQIKPFLHSIEHNGYRELLPEIVSASGVDEDEFFITCRADLERLRGKKLLHIIGERDNGHWHDGGPEGDLELGREVFGLNRLKPYADDVRLVVVENLTHYGHIEGHNERLANLMVTSFVDYFGRG